MHLYFPQQEAIKFTVHSLEASTLSWASQLDLSLEERAAQGHHSLRNSAGCVEKCRRDDLLPALRCQRRLIQALADAGYSLGQRDPRAPQVYCYSV